MEVPSTPPTLTHALGQQLHQAPQHFVAIAAFKRQRELCGEQSVFRSNVIPAPPRLKREIALAPGQFVEGRGQRNPAGIPHRTVMAACFAEIERCFRLGTAFDLLWDLPELTPSGYREIVRVRARRDELSRRVKEAAS